MLEGLFIFLFFPVFSQDYIGNVEFYSYENGLAGRFANYTFEDSRGVIWIGTQYGLHRFDGRDFVIFDETTGLPFPQVMEIYEDQEGWLWLFRSCLRKSDCFKDLCFFNSVTHQVLTFEERFGEKTPFQPEEIVSIMSDASQMIYITAKNHLIQWSAEKAFQQIELKEIPNTPILVGKLSEKEISAIYTVGQSEEQRVIYVKLNGKGEILWSQTIPGVSASLTAEIFKGTKHLNSKSSIANHILIRNHTGIGEQEDKSVFVINERGEIVQKKNFAEDVFGISDSELDSMGIYSYDHKLYWFMGFGKFKIYERGRGLIYDFAKNHRIFGKGHLVVRHIYFSSDGTLWMAGRFGVFKVGLKKNPFERILYNPLPDLEAGLKYISRVIYPLNSGEVGMFSEPYMLVVEENNKGLEFRNYKDNEGLYDFIQDSRGSFGSAKNGIIKIDLKTLDKELIFQYDKSFSRALKFHKGKQELWVGTDKGLWSFDTESYQMAAFDGYNGFEPLKNSSIRFFYEESDDKIWLCTNSGLYLFSPEKGIINHFGKDQEKEHYLPVQDIYHIQSAKAGGYWIAAKEGLISWDGKDSWQHFTIKNGLTTNWLLAVYEDDYGFLWMPTNKGLIQFQKSTGLSKTWKMEDGLSQNEMEPNSHYQHPDGSLYFGTTNGFTKFHPKDFKDFNFENRPDVPLTIIDFEQFSGETNQLETRTEALLKNQEIILEPDDRFFNIRLVLGDYSNPEKTKFAYRISGEQDDWIESKENVIRISRLPYGSFTLDIKGKLSDGQYSVQELHIPIKVLKPFYLQIWFLILAGLFFLIGGQVYYNYRTRKLKRNQAELEKTVLERTEIIEKQKEELQNLDKVKSRFFANVSHELRTPLTLMLGPVSSMLKSNKLDNRNFTFAKLIQNNAKDLLNLVSEILDLTKLESGNLELNEEPTTFYPFTQRIISAFESHAHKQNIQLEFHYLADEYLQLNLDKNKFEKIFNNLLSNALKFTPSNGNINVLIEDRSNRIQLNVSDTGYGIHPDDLPYVFNRFYQSSQDNAPTEGGTGIGLALCMEFANLMNGNLWVESTIGKGSSFYFEFPKKQILGVVKTEDFTITKEPKNPSLENEITLQNNKKGEPNQQKETILVVEDNHALRDYIELILSDTYQIVTAENGQIAWELLTVEGERITVDGEQTETNRPPSTVNRQPDLILSDIMMPFLDGYQLLQRLKKSDQFRQVPVIMLTARAEMKDKLKALRIGVDDYMLKPFEEEELFARIENLLRNSNERMLAVQSLQSAVSEKEESKTLEISDTLTTGIDLQWLEDLEMIVKKELSSFQFNVGTLAEKMAMSKRPLEIKIKRLTGLTPSKYIQEIRFNQARQILENRSESTVKAVAFSVGMKDPIHFSRQFKARFGKSPADYFRHF